MKKILLYLTIAWAIFSLNSVCARNVEPELGFKIAQQACIFDSGRFNGENVFLDVNIEDTDEDDSDDSEKEKTSSGRINHFNNYLSAQNFFTNTFIKVFPSHLLFPLRTSLLVFMCIWRI